MVVDESPIALGRTARENIPARYAWQVPANHLSSSTSPYLRQHAHQPVAWYPWGNDALAKAAAQDKPLFISIGYASCHWCHVMAHESFDDPAVAELLNNSFISIKIDREERPDLDATFMAATQAQHGHGGWPNSVFATPDGRPFYTGTYFPPEDRPGIPSFTRVVTSLADAWSTSRDEIEERADTFYNAVASEANFSEDLAEKAAEHGDLHPREVLTHAMAELAERFDSSWGGFSPAPKFPRPSLIELCLLAAVTLEDQQARTMAMVSLDAMAAGGLYDHLAGGFARYSTDEEWLVPHFEKMLTDQAMLAVAYLHGYVITGNEDYAQIARETLNYVLDELWADEDACYGSHDADADGREGSHAVFTETTVRAALIATGDEALVEEALSYFCLSGPPTFEGAAIVHRPLGASLKRSPEMERVRRSLLAARRRRVQPDIDTKIILEWNAMAASALAQAAQILGEDRFGEAAERIVRSCLNLHTRADGRLLRSYAEGRADGLAGAADYAWLVDACTRLYELTAKAEWLGQAVEVGNALLRGFWDGDVEETTIDVTRGGLFTTGHDAPTVLVRVKDVFDSATPSANSVAMRAFSRLGALSEDVRFVKAANRLIERARAIVAVQPTSVADMTLGVIDQALRSELVIPGPRGPLLGAAEATFTPGLVIAHGEPLPTTLFVGRENGNAYLCRQGTCSLPMGTTDDLMTALRQGIALRASH